MSQASWVFVPLETPWTVLGSRVNVWGGIQLVLVGALPQQLFPEGCATSHIFLAVPWPPANPTPKGLDGRFSRS